MAFQPQELTPTRSMRHFYGAELRRCRIAADLSLVKLADVVASSKSTLARVETAQLMIPPGLSEALDAAFGTDGHFVRLYALARNEVHPDQYRRHMDFEHRARVIEHYATQVVPGLVQTEAYMRALFALSPRNTPEVIEEKVAARLGRQERLRSANPPRFAAILEETVLHRPVGGPQVMREQLAALLPLMHTENTLVQVAPVGHDAHILMYAPLVLMRLPDGMTAAWEEGRYTGRLSEDAEEVEQLRGFYDALRATALSPQDSAAVIQRAMEEYEPCDPPEST
ncbi:helix-turn-helix domain-containing protein [Streptomyces boncukensis]|uniref:Helix-turn-helix domain-containing protein n=1 Tax=Streptomyces boncukensis TaxID=2711219 RepID=A0A6G4X398_9ACTN|nr:helix-turn-helix transcriptional regulator [Streptomyces boncukensis]NGO72009.1 helix-turn-helix domain-containing protein [Streptomyces boncukensis]